MLGFDRNEGPSSVAGLGTVHLSLGPTTFFAPSAFLDSGGNGAVSATLPASSTLVGRHYHAQAVAWDPTATYGWTLSTPWSGGIHPSPGPMTTSTVLPAGEDTYHQVTFTPGSFQLYGSAYTEFFVSSNGLLSFGAPEMDPTESVLEFMLGPAKVAPLWDDFSPQLQGEIRVESGADYVRVVFADLRQYGTADHNDFQVTLCASGAIMMEWPHLEVTDGLVGIGPGGWQGTPVQAVFMGGTEGTSGGANACVQQFFPATSPCDLSGAILSFVPESATGGYTWIR